MDCPKAILRIDKFPNNPFRVKIQFDWTDFELDPEDKRFKPKDQLTENRDYSFHEKTVEEIFQVLNKGIISNDDLMIIGYNIWDLFPRNIQQSLEKFDTFADENFAKTKTPLNLIIFTDYLTIPWELCITRRKDLTVEQGLNWFKKFIIGNEICDISNLREKAQPPKDRFKAALILKPFKEDNDTEFFSKYNEEAFWTEYESLKKLISEIEKKKDVEISVHECPKKVPDLVKIMDALARAKHDLVLYLGSYNKRQGIVLYNPATKQPKYFSLKKVGSGSNVRQAIFLDACQTGIEAYKQKAKITAFSKNPSRFLKQGTSAFIGTIQEIQPTVAVVFAKYFLKSLFLKDSSLAKSIYDARIESTNHFKNDLKDDLYEAQAGSFSLYGQNTDILLNSFRRSREKMVMVFPSMIEDYFKGFLRDIFPSSIPGVIYDKKDSFQDVEKEILQLEKPFIADLPIVQATNLIFKNKGDPEKELVIIGGLFRLKPSFDDCSLYMSKDCPEKSYFLCADPNSFVTIMGLSYLMYTLPKRKRRVFEHKSSCRKMPYDAIYENMMNMLDSKDYCTEPFLLASNYKKLFDDELESKKLGIFKKVSLFPNFLKTLKTFYPETEPYDNIPAEVLVTRKKDLDKDRRLYEEVFSSWMAYSQSQEEKGAFLQSQDAIIHFTEEDIEMSIALTTFVLEKLNNSFVEISGKLSREDFSLLQTPDLVGITKVDRSPIQKLQALDRLKLLEDVEKLKK